MLCANKFPWNRLFSLNPWPPYWEQFYSLVRVEMSVLQLQAHHTGLWFWSQAVLLQRAQCQWSLMVIFLAHDISDSALREALHHLTISDVVILILLVIKAFVVIFTFYFHFFSTTQTSSYQHETTNYQSLKIN